jgi:hypothetical protein
MPNILYAKDYIYAACSNVLHIIDCETDTVIEKIRYNDYIAEGEPSKDGNNYYMHNWHKIYNVNTNKNEIVDIYRFETDTTDFFIGDISVSQNNQKLYISSVITKRKSNVPKLNVLPPQLIVFDIEKSRMIKSYEIPYNIGEIITLRNDPNHIILIGYDIYKFNLNTGEYKVIKKLTKQDNPREVKYNQFPQWKNWSPGDHGIFNEPAYGPKGLYYLLINRNNSEISMIHGEEVYFMYSTVIDPNKEYIYGVMDELVKVKLDNGKTITSKLIDKGTYYSVAITSDGEKVYAGPGGNDITVYDADNLEKKSVIPLESDGAVMHRITK